MKLRWMLAMLTSGVATAWAGDYAWEAVLNLPSSADGFYQTELSPAVYRGSRSELRDIRVLDAKGVAMPFAFVPEPTQPPTQRQQSLAFFPVRAQEDGQPQSLKLEANANGQIRLERILPAVPASDKLAAYILDARSLRKGKIEPQSISFDWKGSALMLPVQVEASDDLQNWQQVGSGSLVELVADDQRIKQQRVDIQGNAAYYRLRWQGTVAPHLTAVTAEWTVSPNKQQAQRVWVSAPATLADQSLLFDLGGVFPAEALRLEGPQTRLVLPVTVWGRAQPEGAWHQAAVSVMFRLNQNGSVVTSPALELPPQPLRYWKLQVDSRVPVPSVENMQLKVAYRPRQIVWLAQGSGPYRLAWGLPAVKAEDLPYTTLVPGADPEAPRAFPVAELQVAREVHAGAGLGLQGEGARRLGLWGLLLLGVAALGWMVWKLAREVKNDTTS